MLTFFIIWLVVLLIVLLIFVPVNKKKSKQEEWNEFWAKKCEKLANAKPKEGENSDDYPSDEDVRYFEQELRKCEKELERKKIKWRSNGDLHDKIYENLPSEFREEYRRHWT